ncbi:xanthine dehydrogenase family protein molybdopterin-binding subunit [Litorilinea aerophila]|uniref:Xanthine dehydrogenase family protein molybdopterin-binding subunit n=1 Tax=Litorilinea aerophila TaxID=1204385 RepID=A0A540VAZ7_9CHLR|nr:xanthine dehydrogenase family protein molybdopterin-binding subunit [Litorilinea aerophila]MCC9078209.1 xanthine dehydrogenase family protein molybdopterin-binding subunit [Litorilinea aerophila]GIV80177.1 MAG: oxidoreductase [Litorilinea sp.]
MTDSTQQVNGHSTNGKAFKVIGTRPIRHDGVDKVTGRALYANDPHLPNTLYGKILRSPHAHARIRKIDTSKAEAYPGVHAVVTAADMAEVADKIAEMGEDAVNLRYLAANILAHDKVLYHGHAVAAVAADSPHVAEEALKLIEVDYEVLPPVLDVKEAMKEDAPILLEDLRTDELGKKGDKPTNVAAHIRHQRGDLEKGFAEADVIVEREFKTAMVHQGYIEPQASTVIYKEDGRVEVITSTQGPWQIRGQVAELLGLPVGKVVVNPTEIGGGFGGKFTAYTDVPAALLSRKAGHRPVKIALSRTEVLRATGPTSGSYIRVKMGATKDGKITAAQAELIYEAGAFPGSPVGAACGVILAPYRLENVQIDGYDVVVNKPQTGAYRAPGGTNAAFASETVIDELAEKLGIDPLEFRRRNAAVEGDRRPDGPVYARIGYLETVEAAMNHPHYKTPLEGKYRGRGVASGFWFNGGGQSCAEVNVGADGIVNLIEGSTDIGGTRTSMAMQLAETLGIPAEQVNPKVVNTESIGFTSGTGGSSVTFKTGVVAYELGKRLINQMREGLASYWDVEVDAVHFADGVFSHGDEKLTFSEAAKVLNDHVGPIVAAYGTTARGAGPGFATHIVDVEVDPETGKVTILRYTAVQDVGRAIHPAYVEGQIQGGVAQGVGWALNEEYFYDAEGHLLNSSLLDYRMPTALDLPMIDCVLVEVPNPTHPYGVRGVGEVPIVPPAAALANAIYRAVGVRMTELPMNPAKVTSAMLQLA